MDCDYYGCRPDIDDLDINGSMSGNASALFDLLLIIASAALFLVSLFVIYESVKRNNLKIFVTWTLVATASGSFAYTATNWELVASSILVFGVLAASSLVIYFFVAVAGFTARALEKTIALLDNKTKRILAKIIFNPVTWVGLLIILTSLYRHGYF